ncbi:MAG: UTP--glucose-1-phosphate uridylyltransferase GalU [Candidatus Aquicultor sp.]|nr:UTP--glucose-1-phosphate uridylyltransferase GalU [Candidatus Aquicultor sp.]
MDNSKPANKRITKAVIPAAGLGTRFLPITKSQPKEMVPVVDKPTIQYVVEEAVASGIDDILIITGRGKRAIEDHFDRSFELEAELKKKNDHALLAELETIAELADIHYIRQKVAAGLGHAVLCAKKHIGENAFAVLLGDIITLSDSPCTKDLIGIYERYGASVIAVQPVPIEDVRRYGVIKGEQVDDGLYRIVDLVEKPTPEKAPSNLAVLGRYVLTPAIFDCLEQTKPGLGGEIQLTDALRLLLEREEMYALEATGPRYDIGNKLSWIKATVELALMNEEMGEELRVYLQELLRNK